MKKKIKEVSPRSGPKRKWLPHWGTLRVIKKPNGELRIKAVGHHCCMSDSQVRSFFVWLGNYLAIKNKLPKHIQMQSVAVSSNRVTKQLFEMVAKETLQIESNR